MITDIDESKTLTKHISCKCKRRFGGKKYKSNQCWNNGKCLCGYKKINVYEKNYIWNPATCNCKNGKYLANFVDKIICDEIIDVKETNFNEKNITFKTQSFYMYLSFY